MLVKMKNAILLSARLKENTKRRGKNECNGYEAQQNEFLKSNHTSQKETHFK